VKLTLNNKAILTEASTPILKNLAKELTLPNPAYQEAQKHGRWTGNIDQELKFYEKLPRGISFPRGYARRVYLYCAREGQVPEVIDQRRTLPEIDFKFKAELRDYQQKALDDILSRDDGVLEASTGSGKTVMALAAIAARKQPTLILTHTRELMNQWKSRVKSFLGIDAGQIGSGKMDIKPVTIGMVQTVRKRLASLPESFGHLIIDECHRTPSTTFSECVAAFDAKYMLGLSATPYRRDKLTKLINFSLGDLVHRVDPVMLQKTGAVLEASILMPRTEFRYDYRDDYQAMIAALVEDRDRNQLITDRIISAATYHGGTCLVVSDRVEHLHTIAQGLDGPGLNIEILTGKTPQAERSRIVTDVQAGKINVLLSTIQLIGEGFDCPGLDTLFLTTPIKFKGRLLQVVGRILRPAPGKDPYLYDIWDPCQPILNRQALEREKIYNFGG
jgi:superfamily II DNA or RNA helicase